MTRQDAEVIVVGGGPAGAAVATFLAKAGREVILLDRARFPREKPCAEYLSPQASRVLDELGVLATVEAAGGAELSGMKIVSPNGTLFSGEFVSAHGYRPFRDRGLAVRRLVLDALILENARRAGVEVRDGPAWTVTGVEHEMQGSSVVSVRGAGVTQVLRAPLIVGADGLRSVVARRAGLAGWRAWPSRYAVVAHYLGVAGVGAHGEMHVFRDGYVGLADVGGGVTNVAIVIPRSRAGALNVGLDGFMDEWLARRERLLSRFLGAHRLTCPRVTGPFAWHARSAVARGVALVGDAADFFDPFTGEGIYAALRGAELLAPYAAAAVRESPERAAVALAAYERARRFEFKGKWRVERLVGTAVAFPAFMNRVARQLAHRPELADLLVGVAGDFVPAQRVLHPSFLLRLLLPDVRAASPAPRSSTS